MMMIFVEKMTMLNSLGPLLCKQTRILEQSKKTRPADHYHHDDCHDNDGREDDDDDNAIL